MNRAVLLMGGSYRSKTDDGMTVLLWFANPRRNFRSPDHALAVRKSEEQRQRDVARTKSGNKDAQLRKAAIEEVAEHGLAAASVNRMADRAEVSVGTVYRYYADKNAVLRDAYLHLKFDLSRAMLEAAAPCATSKDKIRTALRAFANHVLANPQHVIFLETVGTATILGPEDLQKVAAIDADLNQLLNDGIADGTLRPAPIEAIATMLLAPIIHTARRAAHQSIRQKPAHVDEILEMCWYSVARDHK